MRLKIEFDCDNAAFEGENLHNEVPRILKEIARKIDRMHDEGKCVDSNGNIVGDWSLKDSEQ